MIKNYVLFAALLAGVSALAQCPTITCPANINVNNDAGNCGAVVTFTTPVGTNPCANATQTFNYTGSIQTWTVPAGVTSVHIEARGAEGGHNTNSTTLSGLGATMIGDFTVTPGQQLKILVGQQPTPTAGNGGGGGTFVTDMSNNPLIVAGGGGGSSQGADSPMKNGQTTTTGGTGAGGGGVGGSAGSGGGIGASGFQSGAGGGLTGNGADGWTSGTGGQAFINGGAGGATNAPANGGYGGGGSGSSYVVGGGGGGYSGGGSGGNSTAGVGGGGGSYNGGTNQVNTGGANSGNGIVVITYSSGAAPTTTQTAGLASGAMFPIGTTTETFMVDDGLGNTTSCSFTIVVTDNENPIITAPANISVATDSGMCSAIVTFTAPVGTDNCSGATTVQTTGLASGAAFPVGTTTQTYVVTDAAGLTSTCSFSITVTDDTPPAFTCSGNVTSCTSVVNNIAPGTVTDNCAGVGTMTYTLSGATTGSGSNDASGSTFNVGTTTVTYTATDVNGNAAGCSFDVLYDPAPVITLGSFNPDTLCVTIGAVSLPSVTPAGGTFSGTGVSGNTFDPSASGAGMFWVYYTYTNTSGCTSMDSVSVTVDLCTGINSNSAAPIEIYPNPTSGRLFISAGMTDHVLVRISEMNGRLVKEEQYSNGNINTDVRDLAPGIYLLHIESNGQVLTTKLIRN